MLYDTLWHIQLQGRSFSGSGAQLSGSGAQLSESGAQLSAISAYLHTSYLGAQLSASPYVILQAQLSSTQSTCKDHSTGNVRPEARAPGSVKFG